MVATSVSHKDTTWLQLHVAQQYDVGTASSCTGRLPGLATIICMPDKPFSAGRLITKKSLPPASTAGFCPSSRTIWFGPPAGEAFSMRNPFLPGGEKYSHRLSGDQHAQ